MTTEIMTDTSTTKSLSKAVIETTSLAVEARLSEAAKPDYSTNIIDKKTKVFY
jgi:hypothetical protein